MQPEFKLMRPMWPDIAGVEAFTVVAPQVASTVTFKGQSDLAMAAHEALDALIRPRQPIQWLGQQHSDRVVELPCVDTRDADGAVTSQINVVCAMRSADCLPIFFAGVAGDRVGIAHAGWKGLRDGIVEATFERMSQPADRICVWLGPAISGPNYEVDKTVFDEFRGRGALLNGVFKDARPGRYLMDLYQMARNVLLALGVPPANVRGGDLCTFSDRRLHSVRRDGESENRMASVIWLKSDS